MELSVLAPHRRRQSDRPAHVPLQTAYVIMCQVCNLGHATPSPSVHLQPTSLQLNPNLKPAIAIHEPENPTNLMTTSAPTSIMDPTPVPQLGALHALLLAPNTSYPAHMHQWADAGADPMLAAGVSCPTLSGGMSCKANMRRRSAPTRTTKASTITPLMSTACDAQQGYFARTQWRFPDKAVAIATSKGYKTKVSMSQ